MQKILQRHVTARRPYLHTDFQYVLLLLHESEATQRTLEELMDRQEHKLKWFTALATQANSNQPDAADVSDGFLLDVFALCLRRLMPYNFDKRLSVSWFGRHLKPCRAIKMKKFIVVSLRNQ